MGTTLWIHRVKRLKRTPFRLAATIAVWILSLAAWAPAALGHCDGLDGPVVKAAKSALESGKADFVLAWVRPEDEAQIVESFRRALAVRKLSREARDLADMYFYEIVVRVHRAGEGAPYTGLKPAGTDVGPAIPEADRALERGDVRPLVELLSRDIATGVRERFERASRARAESGRSVELGREYVARYVEFIHYVEGIHATASRTPQSHGGEEAKVMHDHH